MQQRTRLALALAGTVFTTFGVLTACSTDNGTTPVPSAGTDSGRDTGKDDDDDDDEDTDGGKDPKKDGGEADCSEAPRLRDNSKGGFFCSFFKRDGGAAEAGSASNCGNGETCCNPGKSGNDFPDSFCAVTPQGDKGGDNGPTECAAQAAAFGSEWPAQSRSWECADNQACDNGQVCCMFTWADGDPMDKVNIGKSTDKEIPAACDAKMAFKMGGTRCSATCAADEIQICSKEDDSCGGNTKCTPFEANFRDLGYCN